MHRLQRMVCAIGLFGLSLSLFLVMGGSPSASAQEAPPDQLRPTPTATPTPVYPSEVGPRIVDGVSAEPGEYPWIVHMGFSDGGRCGGALIHPEWVLTAAHCFYDDNNAASLPTTLRLGAHVLSPSDAVQSYTTGSLTVTEYDTYSINNDDVNDIALIKLDPPAVLGERVRLIEPISSPANDDLIEIGDEATVAGWGLLTENGIAPNVLQETFYNIAANSNCNDDPKQICFDTENVTGTCGGDSGGPSVVMTADGDWLQAGIVSYGTSTCGSGFDGYTKVSSFRDWIQTNSNNALTASWLANGDFDEGANGDWTELDSDDSSPVAGSIIVNTSPSVSAHSGTHFAYLGINDSSGGFVSSTLSQTVKIGSDAPTLQFYYQISSNDSCTEGDDAFRVLVDGEEAYALDTCQTSTTSIWQKALVDLSAWAGGDANLAFDLQRSPGAARIVYVDTVSFTDEATVADLSLAKTVSSQHVVPNETLTYTLNFVNNGPNRMVTGLLEDSIPDGVTIHSTSTSGSAGVVISQTSGAPDFSWQVSGIDPGETGTVQLVGTADGDIPPGGQINNTATISAGTDLTTTNNSSAVEFNYFVLEDSFPEQQALNVDASVTLTASFNASLDASSVDTSSFAVHTNYGGYIIDDPAYAGYNSGTLTVTGDSIAFSRSRPFFTGERVQVNASSQIRSSVGGQLKPTQWGFTIGEGSHAPRCVGDFLEVPQSMPGVANSSVAWGDYDNDGDPDILLTGISYEISGPPGEIISRIYRNDEGTFTQDTTADANLPGVQNGSAAWGDYDNDGDLDILFTGEDENYSPIARIYRNDQGTFTNTFTNSGVDNLPGLSSSDAAWGDYDNDGDLDILLAGSSFSGLTTRIYRNNGDGTFTDIAAGLPGIEGSSVDWGDYDNDGDLDLVLAGWDGSDPISEIYRNSGNDTFTASGISLTGADYSSAAWGDFDSDGNLDLVIGGEDASGNFAVTIYRNSGSATFSAISQGVSVGVVDGSLAWADHDNDGDLDLLVTGEKADTTTFAALYRNDDGVFVDMEASLSPVAFSSVAWADFDGDGGLDILLTGERDFTQYTKLYRNSICFSITSHAPSANELAVHVARPITATMEAAIESTTVTSRTFSVHRQFQGYVTITPRLQADASDSTMTRTVGIYPETPFFAGESVQVVASSGISGTEGSPLSAKQWGFTAGGAVPHCEASYVDSGTVDDIFIGVSFGKVSWADYDRDGDLDILLIGQDKDNSDIVRIYRNVGGSFEDSGNVDDNLPSLIGEAAWGDYDNDGDLDLAMAGSNTTKLMINNRTGFVDSGEVFAGISDGSLAWGDYDNDGDLDLLVTGTGTSALTAKLYRNDGGTFTDTLANIEAVGVSTGTWVDYDNDGDLDMMITGMINLTTQTMDTFIYRNVRGEFIRDTTADGTLDGVVGSVAWGDYDNDGDLDLLMTGYPGSDTPISKIYRNDGGTFTDLAAGLVGVSSSSVAWGDYDSDGDLDILLTGEGNSDNPVSRLYRNDAGSFVDVGASLANVRYSSVAWGDYDNDGDLDILLAGSGSGGTPITKLYRKGDCTAVDYRPLQNSVGVTVTQNVTVSYSAPIVFESSIGDQITLWGEESGRRGSLVSVDGSTITVTEEQDFFTGERVRVVSSQGISTTDGYPAGFQWGFTAGPVADRCLAGFNSLAEPGLAHLAVSSADWGDYDNDGDLDVLLTGVDSSLTPTAKIYRNDGGSFVDIQAPLTGILFGEAKWGDYDGDRDLDLILVGSNTFFTDSSSVGAEVLEAKLYRNDSGSFVFDTVLDGSLPGLLLASADWGDYDNDGDLDLLVTGFKWGSPVSYIYENIYYENIYENQQAALIRAEHADRNMIGVYSGIGVWGDYDNDGDLDILISGRTQATDVDVTIIYRNDHGLFVDTGTLSQSLPALEESSVDWGDYDNDGDLDILIAGEASDESGRSGVYRNDGSSFTDINASLPGVDVANVNWGDYDNDGDLDILLVGKSGENPFSRIYRNDGSDSFVDISAGLVPVEAAAGAWGDYDNDGDLDILLAGAASDQYLTAIYRNDDCTTLAINKSATRSYTPQSYINESEPITYTIAITNIGTSIASNVIVSDSLQGILASDISLAPGERVTYTYGFVHDDGPLSIVSTATVTSAQSDLAIGSMTLSVLNGPPSATFANNGPVNDGSTATVTFSNQFDPSTADTNAGFTYAYDFDNDGTYDLTNDTSGSATVPASYLTGVTSRTVKGRITDKDDGSMEYTTDISVNAPTPTPTATPTNTSTPETPTPETPTPETPTPETPTPETPTPETPTPETPTPETPTPETPTPETPTPETPTPETPTPETPTPETPTPETPTPETPTPETPTPETPTPETPTPETPTPETPTPETPTPETPTPETPTPETPTPETPAPGATVSGILYNDANNDGSQNNGEEGIGGAEVTINDEGRSGDQFQQTTTTDADGRYTFTDVPVGQYTLQVSLPSGLSAVNQPSLQVSVDSSAPVTVPSAPIQIRYPLFLPTMMR